MWSLHAVQMGPMTCLKWGGLRYGFASGWCQHYFIKKQPIVSALEFIKVTPQDDNINLRVVLHPPCAYNKCFAIQRGKRRQNSNSQRIHQIRMLSYLMTTACVLAERYLCFICWHAALHVPVPSAFLWRLSIFCTGYISLQSD